ncbi:MAG: choice-of-anchor D domain-containing protein, partial [Polyangiaceae bacterium]
VGGGDDTAAPAAPASDAAVDGRAGDASTDSTAGDAKPSEASAATSDGAKDGGATDSTVDASSDGSGTGGDATSSSPSGDGGFAKIRVSATSGFDFGAVNCGATGSQTLTIANEGTAALAVQATVVGTGFSIAPTSLSVPAGSSSSLVVSVAVPSTSKAGAPLAGSLTIFTNDQSNASIAFGLSATPTGATIELADQAGEPLLGINFASARVNTPASPVSFQLVNLGNAPATVMVGPPTLTSAGGQFSLDGVTPDAGVSLMLGAHSGWLGTAEFTPTGTTKAGASSSISVNGTICGMSPASITYAGAGSVGDIVGWPVNGLDFGAANCGGAAPASKTFSLKYSGSVGATVTGVTFAGDGGAGFSTNIQVGESIAPDGGLSVMVTAPAVSAPGNVTPITTTLVINTDADQSSTGTSVTLREEPTGAILKFDTAATTTGLPAATTFGSFGASPLLGQPQSQKFGVTNTGNAPATVALFASTNVAAATDAGPADASGDGEAVAGTPPAPFTVGLSPLTVPPAPQTEATDTVVFAPVVAGGNTGSLEMSVAAPELDAGADAGAQTYLCAPLPSSLSLAGTGIGGSPNISPTSLTFNASCGSPAPPGQQTIVLTNTGTVTMNWWISGSITGLGAAQYTVSTTPTGAPIVDAGPAEAMVLGPGMTETLYVSAKPLPGGVTSPTQLNAQFTVETDVPYDSPHVISLQEIPIGDQLAFWPPTLGFGYVPLAPTPTPTLPQTFTVTNYANPGSAPAQFTLAVQGTGQSAYTPASWPSSPGASLSLAPGESLTESVAFAPTVPSQPGAQVATVAVITTDSLCTSSLPAPIQLFGTATAGQVALSTSVLNFGTDGTDGLVSCGATGPTQTFTVTNAGTQPFNLTGAPTFTSTAAAAGTWFTASVTSGGAAVTTYPALVDAGASVTVTVTPKAIPSVVANPGDPTAFADTLTVTTDAVNDTPHAVQLKMQAYGAIIASTPLPTTWSFGTINFGSIGTFPVTITNTGNAPATVSFASAVDGGLPDSGLSQPSIFGLAAPSPTIAVPGTVTSIVGQFTPPSADGTWSDEGVLSVTADGLCSPLPSQWIDPVITLTGSSNGNPPVTFDGTLDFGTSECGGATPAAKSVTLTNATNQTFPLSVSFGSSSSHYYMITAGVTASGSGTLPALGQTTIGVTPKALVPGPGAPVPQGSAPYLDSLNIVVGPSSQPVIVLQRPISWTLSGAVLSLQNGTGPYAADSTGGHTLAIANGGSESATVGFTIQPAGGPLSPIAPVSVPAIAGASPQLLSSVSAPACPTTGSNSTVSFMYSGPVCQFLPASVTVNACAGTQ